MTKALTLVAIGLGLWASQTTGEELPSPAGLIAPFFVILILVLVNGLYVAAEFAIIGTRPSRLEQMAQEGNGRARPVLTILESPPLQDRYIATAQLGITIASLGLGMYGEQRLAHFFQPYVEAVAGDRFGSALAHTIAFVIAIGLLTFLHIVIGEMVPKSLALANPEQTALQVSRPMAWSQTVLGLPVHWLNSAGRRLLQLFKIPPAEGHARLHSPEELELIVSESAGEGLLAEGEEEMIRNIFDFADRQVGQVMTPRRKVQAVPLDLPTDELLRLVTTSSHSRFPVYEGNLDHVVGILHLKDLVRQRLRHKGNIDLRLILRPAPAVPEDQLVERLLAAFKRQRLHMAIVLDEFGGLAGIVTLEDLLEEIVGEVHDEFDVEKEPVVEITPGVLEVAGNYLVDDLAEYAFLGSDEQLPDVETVGGLIHTWLGRPPQVGDVVTAEFNPQVRLTVLAVDGLAVARAKVEYPAGESAAERPPQPED